MAAGIRWPSGSLWTIPHAELLWQLQKQDEPALMVITDYGRAKHFRKAESLVANAPTIPGWKFIPLQPPRPVDFFLQEEFPEADMDPSQFWFLPPGESDERGRVILETFIEVCAEFSALQEHLMRWAVYNILREKLYGLNIREVRVKICCMH